MEEADWYEEVFSSTESRNELDKHNKKEHFLTMIKVKNARNLEEKQRRFSLLIQTKQSKIDLAKVMAETA